MRRVGGVAAAPSSPASASASSPAAAAAARARRHDSSSHSHSRSSSASSTPERKYSAASPAVMAPLNVAVHSPAPSSRIVRGLKSFLSSPITSVSSAFGLGGGGGGGGSRAAAAKAPVVAATSVPSHANVSSASGKLQSSHGVAGRKRPRQEEVTSEADAMSAPDEEQPAKQRPRIHEGSANAPFDLSSRSSNAGGASKLLHPKASRLHSPHTSPALRGVAAAAPSSSSSSSSLHLALAPLVPQCHFNGNQWTDRYGNPRKNNNSASAKKKAAALLHPGAKRPASVTNAASSSAPAAASASKTLTPAKSTGAATAAAPRGKTIAAAGVPASSLTSLARVYAPSPPQLLTGAAAAAVAASSTPATAAASSSSSSSQLALLSLLPDPVRLPPHPNAFAAWQSSSSSSSRGATLQRADSSLTPRKRQQQLLEQQQHMQAMQHNMSYHSAAAGNPLHVVHHYHNNAPTPHTYVHFRRRFKPNQRAGSAAKARSKALMQQLSAASVAATAISAPTASSSVSSLEALSSPLSSGAAATATTAARKSNGPLSSAAAAVASKSKQMKKPSAASANNSSSGGSRSNAKQASYLELREEALRRHRCTQPSDADWLWESMQTRTPFANVDGLLSSLAPSPLSSFARALPGHQSSIKPFLQFNDCDEDTLRLFTGLKPLVRYHRLRGLKSGVGSPGAAIGGASGGASSSKKSAASKRSKSASVEREPASSLSASSRQKASPPDLILDTLMAIQRRERESGCGEAVDTMDWDDGSGASSSRSLRARRAESPATVASSVASRSSPSSSSLSPFMRALNDTSLLPTSLTMPHHVFESSSPFFVVPLSMQLLLARFLAVGGTLPPGLDKVVSPPQPPPTPPSSSTRKASSSPSSAAAASSPSFTSLSSWGPLRGWTGSNREHDWIAKNEAILPQTHKKLVRLFHAHMQLPPRDTSGSSAAVAGGKGAHAAATSSSSKLSVASAAAASSSSLPSLPPPLLDVSYHFNSTVLCSSLLCHLYRLESCHKFMVSVDALADRLPSYYANVVKCPMALYDIDMRLACAYYDSPLEMLQDLWRCLENALLFHNPPWHARPNTSARANEALEERALSDGLPRDLREQVASIWTTVRTFLDAHWVALMSHQPAGAPPSPRTTPAAAKESLRELRMWMDEVARREVQTLKLVWIKRREVECNTATTPADAADVEEDEEEQPHKSRRVSGAAVTLSAPRRRPQFVSQWCEAIDPNLGVSAAAAASTGATTSEESGESEHSDSSSGKARKQTQQQGGKKRARSSAFAGSPMPGTRPTRAHPFSWDGDLHFFPQPFPPPDHSRSHAGRHADNVPLALLRKLARRAGKIPYSWDTKWFLTAKVQHA